MKREPLVNRATIVAIVGAVLTLLVEFGVDLTGKQQAAILGVATIIAPLVVAAVTRHKVTPVDDPRR